MPPHRALRALLAAGLLAALAGTAPVAAADDQVPGPTPSATVDPTAEPSPVPTSRPAPSEDPVASPDSSPEPTLPTPEPTPEPTPAPTPEPTGGADPSVAPTPGPDPSAAPTPGPDPSPTAAPSPAPDVVLAWPGRFNLYRSGAWVRQYRDYTCTAASAQTMLNLILRRSDRSLLQQLRIIKYARAHDTLRFSAGSDPAGWARAVTHFGGGTYSWRTFSTRAAALRYAATRMLVTGKPAGLLVWKGHHAWTMTGFTSTSDPRTDPGALITGVYVAPPLVGVDPRPNTYIPAASLGTFARYMERDGLAAWVGRWVVVAP